MDKKITIPEDAGYILNTLHAAGYEAYVVGGCVRDALLGRRPEDWDITTSARPEQVKTLFRRTIDTGIQHGTVTVMLNKTGYEVTTYRIDGIYTDHRRPTEVSFTSELKEDMRRRDFTINAMAYNEEEGLVDHFQGQEDLKQRVIRCVGDPMERFDEDALRVLRALRFAGQLDFSIAPDTLEAMKTNAVFLKEVSAERIRVELTKLLLSDHPELLAEIGYPARITQMVLPELDAMLETKQENPHHCYDVGRHCLEAVRVIAKTPVLRWTMLLHDVAKPNVKTIDENGVCHFYRHAVESAVMAAGILKRLKFDNDTIRQVRELVYWHDYNWGDTVTMKKVRKAASKIGPDYMQNLFAVQRADVLAQSPLYQEQKLALLEEIRQCYKTIREQAQCVTVKELAIDGGDLIKMGMKPGKKMGEVLQYLLEEVVEQPEKNTKEQLLQQAAEWNAIKEEMEK